MLWSDNLAKDKVVISIETNFFIIQNKLELWNYRDINNDNSKYRNRIGFYNKCYFCNKGIWHLEFLKNNFSKSGLLILECSLSKLINGSNSIPVTDINMEQLMKLIVFQGLDSLIDISRLPNMDKWSISRDENFIDIYGDRETIEALYDVIAKTQVNRKNIDLSNKEKGTVYFYSGSSRKRAGCLIKVYFKLKEMIDKKEDTKYIDRITSQNCTVLRIEFKSNRSKIRHTVMNSKKAMNKRKVGLYNESDAIFSEISLDSYNKYFYFNNDKDTCLMNCISNINNKLLINVFLQKEKEEITPLINHIGYQNIELGNIHIGLQLQNEKQALFSDAIEFQYQQKVIIDMLKDLNMDKRKISKRALYKLIDRSDIFIKKSTKSMAKKVIRYLNGEIETIPLHKRKLKEYMNKILSMGVHYIYSDKEIPAINIYDSEVVKSGLVILNI